MEMLVFIFPVVKVLSKLFQRGSHELKRVHELQIPDREAKELFVIIRNATKPRVTKHLANLVSSMDDKVGIVIPQVVEHHGQVTI